MDCGSLLASLKAASQADALPLESVRSALRGLSPASVAAARSLTGDTPLTILLDGDKSDSCVSSHNREDRLRVVQELLSAGADPRMCDVRGRTPLHLAAALNDGGCVAALVAGGAEVGMVVTGGDGWDRGHTALHVAALYSAIQAAEALVEAGCDVDARDARGKTALHLAMEHCSSVTWSPRASEDGEENERYVMDVLVEAGADVNARDGDGLTPLMAPIRESITWDEQDLVSWAVAHGAKLDVACNAGWSMLHYAVSVGNYDNVVSHMIKLGLDVNWKTPQRVLGRRDGAVVSAFAQAFMDHISDVAYSANIKMDHSTHTPTSDMVRMLLRAGGDVHARCLDGRTILELLRDLGSDSEPDILRMVEFAASRAADESLSNVDQVLLQELFESLEVEFTAPLEALIKRVPGDQLAALVNAQSVDGNTPLIALLEQERSSAEMTKQVTLLIKSGADVSTANAAGSTPLHALARCAEPNVLKIMIAAGVDLAKPAADEAAMPPLHVFCQYSRTEEVKMLLDAGADVHAVDANGETAMFQAIGCLSDRYSSSGGDSVADILVSYGAHVDARNRAGKTPLMKLIESSITWDEPDIITWVVNHGGSVNVADAAGVTLLFYAVHTGNYLSVINRLLKHGCDVNWCAVAYSGDERAGAGDLPAGGSRVHAAGVTAFAQVIGGLGDEYWGHTSEATEEMVQAMLQRGADVQARCLNGHSCIETARALRDEDDKALAMMKYVAEGGTVSNIDTAVTEELFRCVAECDPSALQTIIESQGDHSEEAANVKAVDGNTLLCFALEQEPSADAAKQLALIDVLLRSGASANERNVSGEPPLSRFIQFCGGRSDDVVSQIVGLLLRAGADARAATSGRHATALHVAALYDRRNVAQLLLAAGADADAKDARGRTPMFAAMENVSTTRPEAPEQMMADILLLGGADINARDNTGVTPLMAPILDSITWDKPETIQWAAQHGAQLNVADDNMLSLLWFAVNVGNYETVVRKLLEFGADPNWPTPMPIDNERGGGAGGAGSLEKDGPGEPTPCLTAFAQVMAGIGGWELPGANTFHTNEADLNIVRVCLEAGADVLAPCLPGKSVLTALRERVDEADARLVMCDFAATAMERATAALEESRRALHRKHEIVPDSAAGDHKGDMEPPLHTGEQSAPPSDAEEVAPASTTSWETILTRMQEVSTEDELATLFVDTAAELQWERSTLEMGARAKVTFIQAARELRASKGTAIWTPRVAAAFGLVLSNASNEAVAMVQPVKPEQTSNESLGADCKHEDDSASASTTKPKE